MATEELMKRQPSPKCSLEAVLKGQTDFLIIHQRLPAWNWGVLQHHGNGSDSKWISTESNPSAVSLWHFYPLSDKHKVDLGLFFFNHPIKMGEVYFPKYSFSLGKSILSPEAATFYLVQSKISEKTESEWLSNYIWRNSINDLIFG